MIFRVLLILTIFAVSCQTNTTDDWPVIDFDRLKLRAPSSWNKFSQTGAETYVAGLTNGRDSLWFHYGPYISGPANTDSGRYLYAQDTINGYAAIIMVPKKDSAGSMVLFMSNLPFLNNFSLWGNNIKQIDTVLNIFKTVTFFSSDTTKNSILAFSKFKEYPFGSGRPLFKDYCSACHRLFGNVDGPRIQEFIKGRSTEWVYLFVTNRELVAQDSLYLERHKEFGATCMEYKNLSRQDVRQIIAYIKGEWLYMSTSKPNSFNQ